MEAFSLDLYDEMLGHIEQYRALQAAAVAEASEASEASEAGEEGQTTLASGQE